MSNTDVQTHYESLTKNKISELTKSGGRVVGWHTTPPTAKPHELRSGGDVRSAFLTLLASRLKEDASGNTLTSARSVRAAAVVKRAGGPVSEWLDFRRIYASYWQAALDVNTTEETVRELCALTEELEKIATAP